jgi:RHS repeat-associated protein
MREQKAEHDRRHLSVRLTDGAATASEYAYDAFGRRTISQDAGRTAMRTLYDGFTFEAIRESETFRYGGFTVKHSPGAALPSSTPGIVEEGRYRLVTEGYSTWLGNSPPQGRSAGGAAVPEYRYVGINATLYAKGEAIAVNRLNTDTYTGGTVYLGKDILGSVRGISNDYGLLEDRYEYDAFGKPYKGDLNGGMNLGYTGKPYDTATGMYNYGYRDYQPETARFTTVDPVRDGANWFAYVNNDPVNWVDPDGRETAVLSLPVTPVDLHLFIAVKTEDGTITTKSLYPESQIKAVVDVITGGTQPSVLMENKSNEYKAAEKYFSGEPLPALMNKEATIQPPAGLTQEAFDQSVLAAAGNYPVADRPYNATRGPNSNTYVDDVIESTGAVMPDIKNATQQNWGEKCSK